MPLPPVEFLYDSSNTLLDSLRLAAANRAANLSKQIQGLIDDWIIQEATVILVEWFQKHRTELVGPSEVEIEPMRIGFLERDREKSA